MTWARGSGRKVGGSGSGRITTSPAKRMDSTAQRADSAPIRHGKWVEARRELISINKHPAKIVRLCGFRPPPDAPMSTDLFHWTDEFSIGLQEIDEQHKELVELLNQLHVAIRNTTARPPRARSSTSSPTTPHPLCGRGEPDAGVNYP